MATNPSISVAVAQINCALGELDRNLDTHLDLITQARKAGHELLLFPELSLTGYQLGEKTIDVAMQGNDPKLLKLAEASQDIDVAFGFVEEGAGAQYYNAMALVRNGQLRFVHRKLNLPNYGNLAEGKLFAAGQHIELVTLTDPWRAGLLICADLWNPALVHLAMLQGATMLLAPVNSALGAVAGQFSNADGWDLALRFYAMMYGAPILMANRCGNEGNTYFWGGSRILDAYGKTLAGAPDGYTGLISAELNYADVQRARFRLPTIRDSNPHLIRHGMNQLARDAGTPLTTKDTQ
ncbi:nitrilase [Alcaligenaceae bacterium CGII-47]|nr:nitrilase [Alcaligenaceae bacterium CGII-47]